LFASDENFPKRPFFFVTHIFIFLDL